MQGINVPNHEFTENEIDEAMEYLNQRMHLIPEEMHPFLLKQYSNSLLWTITLFVMFTHI